MRKVIALLALGLLVATSAFAANAVRISQVYGGGGSSVGYYYNDYVELFNSSSSPVAIGGWYLEYGSATGNWGSSTTNYTAIPAGAVIPACGYYLLQVGTAGSGGVVITPTPDFVNTAGPNLSGTSGKVALFTALNANVACGAELAGTLVDKFSYGSANCAEVSPTGTLSTTTVAVRALGGMTDTDNNSTDFTVQNCSATTIHNSLSGTNPECSIVPATSDTWGRVKTLYR